MAFTVSSARASLRWRLRPILNKDRLEPALFIKPVLTEPDVEDGDGDHGDDEVDESVGEHEVDTADVVLCEGNTAPG